MEEETRGRKTLGSAIDEILAALKPLDDVSRRTALRAACDQLGISLRALSQEAHVAPPDTRPAQTLADAASAQPPETDIRSLAQVKAPSTTNERTALVAYYLAEMAPLADRKKTIDKEDLRAYFIQAGFPLPRRPEQALVNARHAGYLDPAGGGKYRLNAVGHNLIAHNLPRGQAEPLKKPRSPKRSRRRSPRVKKARK